VSSGKLRLDYVLRRHDIVEGDIIISSGLDGVFPKGLRVGYVHEVIKPNSGIFQEVSVTPYVDFEKLEEVLVIIDSPEPMRFSEP
jgi:rod shape-determining protein MreC